MEDVTILNPIFQPKSVAVIGASTAPGKLGHDILANLKNGGFAGPLYPVNPKADEILGLQVFKSIADTPEPPELAVVVIPAKIVTPTLEQCAEKGVKGAIVITGGFAETGEEGERLQEEMAQVIQAGIETQFSPDEASDCSPSSRVVARVTAPTVAKPCSNLPAALASDSPAPTMAAPAVNTARPTPSWAKALCSRSAPSPTRWSRLMKFRSRLRIEPDARSRAVNTNPSPMLFIMGHRPPRRGARAAFSSSLASRARCSLMRSMSQSRSVGWSSSACPMGSASPEPPCCCQHS